MKIKVDVARLPEPPYPKTPVIKKPEEKRFVLINRGKRRKRHRENWFYTPEHDAIIRTMRAEGKTFREIGDQLGRSDSAVRHRWKVIK